MSSRRLTTNENQHQQADGTPARSKTQNPFDWRHDSIHPPEDRPILPNTIRRDGIAHLIIDAGGMVDSSEIR